jgi:hypothetical protein
MGQPARHLATWEDLLGTPDDGRVWEVIDGNLEAQPRPRPAHGAVQGLLFADLAGPFYRGRGGPGGWWLVIGPDVELERHEIVAPDIAGRRREHLAALPDQPPIRIRPDWIGEIASRATGGATAAARPTSTCGSACRTTGSWIPTNARSRLSRRARARGYASAPGRTATRPTSARSTPSPSTWAGSSRPFPEGHLSTSIGSGLDFFSPTP